MSTDKATPRPWLVRDNGTITNKDQSSYVFVCDFKSNNDNRVTMDWANAELIVRAVNNHDKLVDAASKLLRAIECNHFILDGYSKGSASISEVTAASKEEHECYSKLWDIIHEINSK